MHQMRWLVARSPRALLASSPLVSPMRAATSRVIASHVPVFVHSAQRRTFLEHNRDLMPVPKKRFGGSPKHQAAILRSMVTALVKHERIRTITQRAKELKRLADRVVTFAKRAHAADAMTDTGQEVILHNRRAAASVIFEYDVLRKLFEELGPRYAERNGGYVRVLKLAKRRKGDDADMSIIEVSSVDRA